MTAASPYRLGILAVLAASILWGTTGTVATFAPTVSPIAIGATAMGMGGLLQAALAWRVIRRNVHRLRRQGRIITVGALAVTAYPLAFYSSMHLAGVAVGTVVSIGTAPLFAALLERVTGQHQLTLRWLVGATLGISGATLLCIAETENSMGGGGLATLLGVGLGFLAGFTYALYSWAAHRVIGTGIPSRAAMGAIFGGAGVLLIPIVLITGAPFLASWSNAAVGVYMGIVPMFVGYVLFGMGLARVRASTAIVITLVEPIVATLLAVAIVRERLPALGWTGTVLVVGSLAVLTVRVPRRHKPVALAVTAPRPPRSHEDPSGELSSMLTAPHPGVRRAADKSDPSERED